MSLSAYVSQVALRFTLEKMSDRHPVLYLWTFTFARDYGIGVESKMWSAASASLVRELGFWGVRVYELTKRGRLHVHLVTGQRFDVCAVRAVVESKGLGRVHVVKLRGKGSAFYVAKYVAKQKRSKILRGVRLWAVIGKEGRRCQVRHADIETFSAVGESVGEAKSLGWRGFDAYQVGKWLHYWGNQFGRDGWRMSSYASAKCGWKSPCGNGSSTGKT